MLPVTRLVAVQSLDVAVELIAVVLQLPSVIVQAVVTLTGMRVSLGSTGAGAYRVCRACKLRTRVSHCVAAIGATHPVPHVSRHSQMPCSSTNASAEAGIAMASTGWSWKVVGGWTQGSPVTAGMTQTQRR